MGQFCDKHIGKRLLVSSGYRGAVLEVEIMEVAPSGEYVLFHWAIDGEKSWEREDRYIICEVLPGKGDTP